MSKTNSDDEYDEKGVYDIFFPHIIRKIEKAKSEENAFVHYTTAENAKSILLNKEIWLRNCQGMSDVSEVAYGIEHLVDFLIAEPANTDLWVMLDKINPSISEKIRSYFGNWVNDLRSNTYIFCLSEFEYSSDVLGRLSMWRGYGKTTGVAIVIKPEVMTFEAKEETNIFTYPVNYNRILGKSNFLMKLFDEVTENMKKNLVFLKKVDADTICHYVAYLLHSLAYCLKHPAFEEELEWRAVYRPNLYPSKYVEAKIATISGIPQMVYSMPLLNIPYGHVEDATLNDIIASVIIGPTDQPKLLQQSFVEILKQVGVEDADEKVLNSNIPYRTT